MRQSVEVTSSSGSDAYLSLLDHLVSHGSQSSPRGMPTTELTDVHLTVTNASQVHVLETWRRPSVKVAATEAAHLVAGMSSLEQLDLASGGRFTQFADGGRLRGAYGPRTYHQLRNAVMRLSDDQDTRQACVTLWRGDELAHHFRDVPCTTSWQFLIRDGKLDMHTVMRSEDAWLGLPYDLEMFGALHKSLANALFTIPGTYTHSVYSFHVYNRNYDDIINIMKTGIQPQWREPVLSAGASPEITALLPVTRWRDITSKMADVVMRGAGTTFGKAWQCNMAKSVPPLPLTSAASRRQWQICSSCRYVASGACRECEREREMKPGNEMEPDS